MLTPKIQSVLVQGPILLSTMLLNSAFAVDSGGADVASDASRESARKVVHAGQNVVLGGLYHECEVVINKMAETGTDGKAKYPHLEDLVAWQSPIIFQGVPQVALLILLLGGSPVLQEQATVEDRLRIARERVLAGLDTIGQNDFDEATVSVSSMVEGKADFSAKQKAKKTCLSKLLKCVNCRRSNAVSLSPPSLAEDSASSLRQLTNDQPPQDQAFLDAIAASEQDEYRQQIEAALRLSIEEQAAILAEQHEDEQQLADALRLSNSPLGCPEFQFQEVDRSPKSDGQKMADACDRAQNALDGLLGMKSVVLPNLIVLVLQKILGVKHLPQAVRNRTHSALDGVVQALRHFAGTSMEQRIHALYLGLGTVGSTLLQFPKWSEHQNNLAKAAVMAALP